ncbi:MAG: PEP/pyruvate-binding domain-containing protein, partial [Polyangiales bacterium]
FFAGNIQTYYLGDGSTPTYGIQFYPDDVISEATLLVALQTIKAAFTIPGAKLAFVATGSQQTFARIGPQAAALGIDLLTIDQVLGDIKYVGMNLGEAWGYLRIFPADVNLLRPTDIPVFDDLPLDLSVVAGTITKAYQDINSHVNLKAKERNTPNMVLRDAALDHPTLAPFADKPIHLTVTNEGYTIEATTDAIVQQKLQEKLAGPWIPLPVVDDLRLISFDEECPAAAASCFSFSSAFGGKTTGLGFLAGALGRTTSPTSVSTSFGYDLTPRGFGIPVKFYRDFVNAPENALLKSKIAELITAEKTFALSPADRNAKVLELQTLFLKGKVPGSLVADVTARLAAVMPGVDKFKFRSSATSEDVPNFNGAGLYDSFAVENGKVDNADLSCILETETDGVVTKLKVKPKTPQCGIKAVFGSLWNPRAIVERTFGRLDHESAGMGIAINPSYGDELANLVLVTRVVGSDGVYGYTLSVQKGENLVTNPLPGTITEFDVASFSDAGRPPRISTTRFAKPTVADPVMTTTILTNDRMLEIVDIAKKVEIAYCKAKSTYYPGGSCNSVWLDTNKPLSLDMEIKILPDGKIQFKQVREFHGR